MSSLQQYHNCDGDEITDPLERLRFFCSLAMSGQDWLDVEPFFDAAEATRNEWIPVSERLPEDNQPVMAACKMDTGEWWFGNCIYRGYFPWVQLGNPLSPITHWQPIRPPKGE